MRILTSVGALALTLGMASALPAIAADDYWSYPDGTYIKHGYDADYGYRRSALMSRYDLMREVETQGYYNISDLRPTYDGRWRATAYIDGELVSLVIDPYDGRVLSANEI